MKILVSFILLFACSTYSFAQDTVFYKTPRERVNTKNNCDYYSFFSTEKGGLQKEISFTKNDIKQSESYFIIENGQKVKEGTWKTWYLNGQLKSEENYDKDVKEGTLTTYWENGQKKRDDIYKNDSLVTGNCYNNEGLPITYYAYEIKPHFPGGEEAMKKYLMRKIHYPQSIDRQEGVVLARFIVTDKGKITAIETLNKSNEMMQNEVVKVIRKMPKWVPGKLDGVPVSAYYVLPVSFTILPLSR